MPNHNAEFALILNHVVKITRRAGFTTTPMGQRRSTGETVIASGASVFFYMNKGEYKMLLPGNFTMGDFTMMALPSEDVQPGDLVYPIAGVAGLTLGQVINVMPYQDFDGMTHHIDVQIKRL